MSTTTVQDTTTNEPDQAPMVLDLDSTPPVPFRRLVAVEARKMVDTKAGRWLLGITGGLLLLALGLTLLWLALSDDATITARGFAEIMVIPVSLLVPVLAIVTVTGEWGQRTHLVTFTLEPKRLRVIAAKLVTVLGLAVTTMAVAIAFGALGNVIYGAMTGNEVVWNVELSWLGWTSLLQLLFFLTAFGLSMVLLSTPAAIAVVYVVTLVLPFMVYSVLYFSFDWARDLIPWIAMDYSIMPFMSEVDPMGEPWGETSFVDYARVAVSLLLWVVAPLVAGTARILRSEVK